MVRCSNAVVCFINFLSLLIAVPVICLGLYLRSEAKGECVNSGPSQILLAGCILLVLSLLGIFGSCCRLNFFLGIYLFLTAVMILLVSFSVGFGFAITTQVSENSTEETYTLGTSSWLQDRVSKKWGDTQKCLKELKLCDAGVMETLDRFDKTISQFVKDQLTPIQIGCCKPATECGFTSVNGTFWTVSVSGIVSVNADCKKWSNREDKMCFDCDSCKVGIILRTKKEWRKSVYYEIAILVYLCIIYSITTCAYRNNEKH